MLNRIEGHVGLSILKDTEHLAERFESAFRSTVKTYIESTSIKVLDIEFHKYNGKIYAVFAFDNLVLEYNYENDESGVEMSSTRHEGEFGRALFEFWTKCLVESLFEEELKVESKYTEITFFNFSPMGNRTI
ncbi:hypothetical protein [Ectobacillus panaciterrae]|uniref:hypothetical protein n=1 Tax=Ectobacillus panaciterrae TaxID=363872 RepID=UPI0004009A4C|nr:hypothetical protein [Ectobacillus panaciterrae]